MKALDLNTLLEYYNGFSVETGESLIWNNCSIEQSKMLAYNEIMHRSKIYQKEHEVEPKVNKINRIFFDLNSILRSPANIYIVDSGVFSETNNFVSSLSDQTINLYNTKINTINSQLIKQYEEIQNIWKNDPDNLRYQSRFVGARQPNQYLSENIVINTWICTGNRDYSVKISSHCLDMDYSKHIAKEASKYDRILYPIFRNKGCGEKCLNDFLYNLMATNQRNIKLIVCWINDILNNGLESGESYMIETQMKIEHIKNRFFGNRIKFIVLDGSDLTHSYKKLIEEI